MSTLSKLKFSKRFCKRIASLSLLCYLVLCAYACSVANSLIFQPHPPSYTDDQHILKLNTENGEKISAYWQKTKNAKYTILYSHGNAEDIGDILHNLPKYNQHSYNIMTYDYRGYGTSEGTPSESNTYQDIQAAYNHLIANGITPEHIIIYGRSVGGGPATWLATREPVKALVLESTFTSAFRVITHYQLLPFDKFNNIGRINQINCPLLVIHGDQDQVIPQWHSKNLYNTAKPPKTIHIIKGAGHNNLHNKAQENYWHILKKFTNSL